MPPIRQFPTPHSIKDHWHLIDLTDTHYNNLTTPIHDNLRLTRVPTIRHPQIGRITPD